MKNNSLLKFALVASLALNVTVLATVGYISYNRTSNWVSPFGTAMKKDRFLFEELSLRPEQLKSMRARTVPFRGEIDRRRQEIVMKRKSLIILMRSDRPDKKAVESAIIGINRMQEEMQKMITSHMLEIKASLDKDQQQKFLDLIERNMTEGGRAGCSPTGEKELAAY